LKRLQEIISEIFETGQFTSSGFLGGKYVKLFEEELTKFLGRPTATVNSGTSALICALWAAGIRAGDEVILPAFSFKATKNAVLALQAKPKYVDVNPNSPLMQVDKIRIGKKTKAVIVVHLFGLLCDKPDVKVPIIEDACQAFGVPGVGFGDYTCYSGYPTKRINTMEGGWISTANIGRIKDLRNHGFQGEFGLNLRMPEINAAMGYIQLINYIARPIEWKLYNYTLSPKGKCPNADNWAKQY